MRWLAVAVTLLAVLVAVDLSLPTANISGALVVTPFLASGGARPRRVGAIGTLAVLAAVGLAFADGSRPHASEARIAVIVVGTVMATKAASVRIRNQQRFLDLSTVAEAAQRAIIRKPAPRVGSVAVATWYQSSVRAATVGGDCYEILATPFGTRVIMGDVRGHGMASVRLAALVLGGFRALAHLEANLATVAHELDLLVARYAADPTDSSIDGEEFVTAVLCQLNDRALVVANCGHPPPLLINRTGRVRRLDASSPACPLGVGSKPNLDHLHVEAFTRMLLYTDGVIEARNRSGKFFDLEAAASGLATGSLDAGIAAIIEELNSHAENRVNDDVALMLLEPLTIGGAVPPTDASR